MSKLVSSSAILLPIDMHGINPKSLETLVGIARHLHCSLLGLILEDIRLQQVAKLPFTTEIVLGSGRERGLFPGSLANRHSDVAADTQKRLTELADKGQVKLDFDQAAGARLHCALLRNGHLDVFFPGRLRWRAASPPTGPAIPRIGLLLTGGGQDMRVLCVAEGLIKAGLVSDIYVLAGKSPSPEQLNKLAGHRTRICVQSNADFNPQFITSLIRQSPYELLILPRDCLAGIETMVIEAALDESGGQILLVNDS